MLDEGIRHNITLFYEQINLLKRTNFTQTNTPHMSCLFGVDNIYIPIRIIQ